MKKFEEHWCDAGTNISEQHTAPIFSIPNGSRMLLHNSSTGVSLYVLFQHAWFLYLRFNAAPKKIRKLKK
jgi:hypothetical protein